MSVAEINYQNITSLMKDTVVVYIGENITIKPPDISKALGGMKYSIAVELGQTSYFSTSIGNNSYFVNPTKASQVGTYVISLTYTLQGT